MKEESKFEVVDRNGRYQVHGLDGLSIMVDNRFDATRLVEYLNTMDSLLDEHRSKRVVYYTVLKRIEFIVGGMHRECGELHILEKCIQIKNLLKEVL